MPLLVRKITMSKWRLRNDRLSDEDVYISADAITNCMKTAENTLSTWVVQTRDEIPEAVLAIASLHQHIDTIDVVCLDLFFLESQGIHLKSTPGNTPVKDLVDRHKDIFNLTYKSLGTVAIHIFNEIKGEKVERYTRGKIKKLLKNAIDAGRLQKNELHESVRSKL